MWVEAAEEKIKREQQQKEDELQKTNCRKRVVKNKKIQKEVAIWDETLNDAWLEPSKTKKWIIFIIYICLQSKGVWKVKAFLTKAISE